MFKEIIIAITAYGKAHSLIRRHGLWRWIVIPGVVYMLLYVLGLYVFFSTMGGVVDEYIFTRTGVRQWLDRMDSGVLRFIFSFTGIIVWLLGALIYFSLFKYFWLIVGAPVFAYLSEKTESLVTGKEYDFSWAQLWRDMKRGVRISLRNLLWQSVYLIALFLLSLVPFAGWAVPFLALLMEAYYFGFSMLDYSFERRNTPVERSISYIGAHKGLAMGNGMVFYLLHMIPLLGWVFAPAYAVIAATLTIVDAWEKP